MLRKSEPELLLPHMHHNLNLFIRDLRVLLTQRQSVLPLHKGGLSGHLLGRHHHSQEIAMLASFEGEFSFFGREVCVDGAEGRFLQYPEPLLRLIHIYNKIIHSSTKSRVLSM